MRTSNQFGAHTLLLILLVMGGLLVACGSAEPDIEVATAVDLGTVDKGEVAEAAVPVRNVGAGTLTVASVSTSCGCTRAVLEPMTIPAGGEATLYLTYDSAAHETDLGPIERYVFIASDDPDEADVQVKFTAFVVAD